MKRKMILAMLTASVMIFGAVSVFALDYYVPEDSVSVTARFFVTGPDDPQGDEFSMVSEDETLVINITESTLIYFEDYVPLGDDNDGMTQMVREVLFGRTLAEVLEGRNLRVIYEESEHIEPVSITVLFETIVPLAEVEVEPVAEVVSREIIETTHMPFYDEEKGVTMIPLRAVAEALGYDVYWDGEQRSVRLGVAIRIWIGRTEAHFGRMAPIELSTAPVIVDSLTFVPEDFFRSVLGKTVYVSDGQLIAEQYSGND